MKAIITLKRTKKASFNILMLFIACLVFQVFPSCELNDAELKQTDMETLAMIFEPIEVSGVLYYGIETFTVVSKAPFVVSKIITNQNFENFENLVLKVQNGDSRATKVSKVEISINGVVVQSADFRKTNIVERDLIGFTDGQTLSIKLQGKAGTFVRILIEGTLATPSIGDNYHGGIVYYILQPSDPGYVDGETHGLIAATTDQSTGITWYNGIYKYIGATSNGISAGAINTPLIVTAQIIDNPTGNFAAKVCDDYSVVTVGGVTYDDWYLPSIFELNLLYLQRSAVSDLSTSSYWSSTEWSESTAWSQNFLNGNQYYYGMKHGVCHVRAVRTF